MVLGIACLHLSVGYGRRGGNISVDLPLFVHEQLKFNDILKIIIHTLNSLTEQIFSVYNTTQKVGHFRKRKRAFCWTIYIISLCLQYTHFVLLFILGRGSRGRGSSTYWRASSRSWPWIPPRSTSRSGIRRAGRVRQLRQ